MKIRTSCMILITLKLVMHIFYFMSEKSQSLKKIFNNLKKCKFLIIYKKKSGKKTFSSYKLAYCMTLITTILSKILFVYMNFLKYLF